MELDARTLDALDADVCIIGAGPAGIAVARDLSGRDVGVLLLESGGPVTDAAVQDLNEGTVLGNAYAGLRATRHRALGGTSLLWNTPVNGEPGAKYVPLDAIDFEPVPGMPLTGWPFDRAHLDPFYRRAAFACGLGTVTDDAASLPAGPAQPLPLDGDAVTSRVYRFGTARDFTGRNLAALRDADNVRLCHHATVTGLEAKADGRKITSATIATPTGSLTVHASTFVLAAGAIENARVLLLHGAGERNDLVGRCFMEHARDYALTLFPASPDLFRRAACYDMHAAADGAVIGGRLALSERAIREHGIPNASATLLPRIARRTGTRGVLDALRRLGRHRTSEGYGWSRLPDLERVYDAFRLIINIEQRPHRENRIVLGNAYDGLGVPRAELHWRWREEDQAGLERVRARFARALRQLGRVDIRADLLPDPNAHHHAGTTRMHPDARYGVVDADCRVHGTDNLYVAGASVFPTAGFANPTLTIVALAIRLAERLAPAVSRSSQ